MAQDLVVLQGRELQAVAAALPDSKSGTGYSLRKALTKALDPNSNFSHDDRIESIVYGTNLIAQDLSPSSEYITPYALLSVVLKRLVGGESIDSIARSFHNPASAASHEGAMDQEVLAHNAPPAGSLIEGAQNEVTVREAEKTTALATTNDKLHSGEKELLAKLQEQIHKHLFAAEDGSAIQQLLFQVWSEHFNAAHATDFIAGKPKDGGDTFERQAVTHRDEWSQNSRTLNKIPRFYSHGYNYPNAPSDWGYLLTPGGKKEGNTEDYAVSERILNNCPCNYQGQSRDMSTRAVDKPVLQQMVFDRWLPESQATVDDLLFLARTWPEGSYVHEQATALFVEQFAKIANDQEFFQYAGRAAAVGTVGFDNKGGQHFVWSPDGTLPDLIATMWANRFDSMLEESTPTKCLKVLDGMLSGLPGLELKIMGTGKEEGQNTPLLAAIKQRKDMLENPKMDLAGDNSTKAIARSSQQVLPRHEPSGAAMVAGLLGLNVPAAKRPAPAALQAPEQIKRLES